MVARLVWGLLLGLGGLFLFYDAHGEDPQNSVGVLAVLAGIVLVVWSLVSLARSVDSRRGDF